MHRCATVKILGCFRTDLFARLFDEDCEGSVLPALFADLFGVQQITTQMMHSELWVNIYVWCSVSASSMPNWAGITVREYGTEPT